MRREEEELLLQPCDDNPPSEDVAQDDGHKQHDVECHRDEHVEVVQHEGHAKNEGLDRTLPRLWVGEAVWTNMRDAPKKDSATQGGRKKPQQVRGGLNR